MRGLLPPPRTAPSQILTPILICYVVNLYGYAKIAFNPFNDSCFKLLLFKGFSAILV